MKNTNWRTSVKNHVQKHQLRHLAQYASQSEDLFALHIPEFFKQQIDFSNQDDVLLKQVLPQHHELESSKGYKHDPVGDLAARQNKGIIQKYHGRVLLITTGACAINCRYCFRREFPYAQNNASSNNWQQTIEYLAQDKSIHEVILSGGDPLMLSTKRLRNLTEQLQQIKHIKTLRIHTRMPLVAPKRINTNFLSWLHELALKKIMVVHCNHANELVTEHTEIFKNLTATGTLLLNQSVLLKNINDNVASLCDLSHKLFDFGILPYYLHQLDKVNGSHHFRVKNKKAKQLHKKIQTRLPGYLVPKLVTEIAGKKSKTLLF